MLPGEVPLGSLARPREGRCLAHVKERSIFLFPTHVRHLMDEAGGGEGGLSLRDDFTSET